MFCKDCKRTATRLDVEVLDWDVIDEEKWRDHGDATVEITIDGETKRDKAAMTWGVPKSEVGSARAAGPAGFRTRLEAMYPDPTGFGEILGPEILDWAEKRGVDRSELYDATMDALESYRPNIENPMTRESMRRHAKDLEWVKLDVQQHGAPSEGDKVDLPLAYNAPAETREVQEVGRHWSHRGKSGWMVRVDTSGVELGNGYAKYARSEVSRQTKKAISYDPQKAARLLAKKAVHEGEDEVRRPTRDEVQQFQEAVQDQMPERGTTLQKTHGAGYMEEKTREFEYEFEEQLEQLLGGRSAKRASQRKTAKPDDFEVRWAMEQGFEDTLEDEIGLIVDKLVKIQPGHIGIHLYYVVSHYEGVTERDLDRVVENFGYEAVDVSKIGSDLEFAMV